MVENQISVFDGQNKFRIDKPIRLIELFAGYGSQALALKYLGVKFEHWKICEWAIKSIQAYKDAHFKDDDTDYSKGLTKEELGYYLADVGVSQDYNKPLDEKQIHRYGEEKLRTIYNNIKATHNLVNIQTAKGKDLEITDTDKYTYLMTYSFPCQDLSSAGLGKGMEKGSGTRSGMLWEVERLLDECSKVGQLPQVLLMENVPEVIGTNNIKHFAKWLEKLEHLGYKCYWKVLNAKDYGVPQNRERCFMVSILGDYYYEFPQTIKLEKKLKDLLEDEVDEKYYLSEDLIKYFEQHSVDCENNGQGFRFRPITDTDKTIAKTITTRNGSRMDDNFIKDTDNYIQWKQKGYLDMDCRAYKEDKCMGTLTTRGGGCKVMLNNDKRQKQLAENIDKTKDGQFLDFYNQTTNATISGTITTRVYASNGSGVYNNYRIRKLTPKECFRLMGVKDEDFENIAQNQSNASLYHLAGDSIVVDVLKAIFSKMIKE